MTGTATCDHRLPLEIRFPRRYRRHATRLSDDYGIPLGLRDRGSSRLRAAVGCCQKNPGQCRFTEQKYTASQASHPRATAPGRARCAFVQSIAGKRAVAHESRLTGLLSKPLDPGQCSLLLLRISFLHIIDGRFRPAIGVPLKRHDGESGFAAHSQVTFEV